MIIDLDNIQIGLFLGSDILQFINNNYMDFIKGYYKDYSINPQSEEFKNAFIMQTELVRIDGSSSK